MIGNKIGIKKESLVVPPSSWECLAGWVFGVCWSKIDCSRHLPPIIALPSTKLSLSGSLCQRNIMDVVVFESVGVGTQEAGSGASFRALLWGISGALLLMWTWEITPTPWCAFYYAPYKRRKQRKMAQTNTQGEKNAMENTVLVKE